MLCYLLCNVHTAFGKGGCVFKEENVFSKSERFACFNFDFIHIENLFDVEFWVLIIMYLTCISTGY